MDISDDLIVPYNKQIVRFAGERVKTRGYTNLRTRLGTGRESEEKRVRYLLVEANTAYNVLLGRPCLNVCGAIISTPHLTMKYPTSRGTICTIRAYQKTTRECYAIAVTKGEDWREETRKLMHKQDDGQTLRPANAKKIARFMMVGGDLYRRGFSTPLLKCLNQPEAQYVMDELHNGICGFHTGRRGLKARILRDGYFWPTMEKDTVLFVQKCLKCHAHSNATAYTSSMSGV